MPIARSPTDLPSEVLYIEYWRILMTTKEQHWLLTKEYYDALQSMLGAVCSSLRSQFCSSTDCKQRQASEVAAQK